MLTKISPSSTLPLTSLEVTVPVTLSLVRLCFVMSTSCPEAVKKASLVYLAGSLRTLRTASTPVLLGPTTLLTVGLPSAPNVILIDLIGADSVPSANLVLTRVKLIVPFLIRVLPVFVFFDKSILNSPGWSEVKVLPLAN